MLTDETLQQLQRYNFDLLAHQELNGQRRMRYIALAHLKDGKNFTEVADALRMTRYSFMRWLKVVCLRRGWTVWQVRRITEARCDFLKHRKKPFAKQSSHYRTAIAVEGFVAKISASCCPSSSP